MSKPKSIFFAAISGNILEYYDFTVYSVFSTVIGRTFFPGGSEFVQVLASLAVFAVGCITRPIGGIFFGYIGDRYGRRVALILSMLGMTIPTFTMGLIPSYQDIGVYAPCILVIFRLIQGLCISGEGAGTAIFILEHYRHLKPGFTTGLVHGSNITGTLIASFIGIIIERYFSDVEFAWRFAFILGGFMGMVGFYLRLKVSETPIFRLLSKKKQILKAPFSHVLRTAWRPMFITFSLGGVASSIVYLVKTYINVFYSSVLHLDNTVSLMYLSYASFVLMIALPISGGIADRIGRLKMITISSIAIILLALPTLAFMSVITPWKQILGLTVLSMLAASISGTAYIFVISLFTPEQRFSGVAFSYNLGIAMFGGTSPVIASWLIQTTGLFYAPAFYIIGTASAFLCILYMMRNTIKEFIKD